MIKSRSEKKKVFKVNTVMLELVIGAVKPPYWINTISAFAAVPGGRIHVTRE